MLQYSFKDLPMLSLPLKSLYLLEGLRVNVLNLFLLLGLPLVDTLLTSAPGGLGAVRLVTP